MCIYVCMDAFFKHDCVSVQTDLVLALHYDKKVFQASSNQASGCGVITSKLCLAEVETFMQITAKKIMCTCCFARLLVILVLKSYKWKIRNH